MADTNIAPETLEIDEIIGVELPSWNDFAGQQSFCECEECEHMAGAPAYLVHILHWLEKCGTNSEGKTPYDVLIERAPYLPHIQLTCENTKAEVPYLRVVLHILEFFAVNKTLDTIPDYGLSSDPEKNMEVSKIAYEILHKKPYPFSLPYHQPLDVIRTYLRALRTNWRELLKLSHPVNSAVQRRIVMENLSMSESEYSLITEFKIDNVSLETFSVYGFNSRDDFNAGIRLVQDCLLKTDITYGELLEILECDFVNPGNDAVKFLENLFYGSTINQKGLLTRLIQIKETEIDDTFETGLKTKIVALLNQATIKDLDPREFKVWVDNNLDAIQGTVVVQPTMEDPCNYQGAVLKAIREIYNGGQVEQPDEEFYKRLYRFVRLYKKGGYTIAELDRLLIASMRFAGEQLGLFLSVSKSLISNREFISSDVRCLVDVMETEPSSLYASLFLGSSVRSSNIDFRPNIFGECLINGVPLKTGDLYNQVLLTGMSLTPVQMDALLGYIKVDDPINTRIDLTGVSVLYGYVVLARKLELPIEDLLQLLVILGLTDALRLWDKDLKKFTEPNLTSLNSFLERLDEINSSSFTVSELCYVLGPVSSHILANQFPTSAIEQMVTSLSSDFDVIAQQHPDPVSEKLVDANFVLNKLMLTRSKEDSLLFMGMLNGTVKYGRVIEDKPDLRIPAALIQYITYDRSTGRIETLGVLSADDWTQIRQDAALEKELRPIYEKPSLFLKEKFSDVLPLENDRNVMLDRIDGAAERTSDEKLKTFYSNYYHPTLIVSLRRNAIFLQLATLFSMDQRLAGLISKNQIDSIKQLVESAITKTSVGLDVFPESAIAELRNIILVLYKSSLLVQRFGLVPEDVEHMLKFPAAYANIDFTQITPVQWKAVGDFSELKKYSRPGNVSIRDFISHRSSDQSTIDSMTDFSVLVFGWPKETAQGIIQLYNYSIDDLKQDHSWIRMIRLMILAKNSGIDPTQMLKWIGYNNDFDSLHSLASDIKSTFLQKLDPSVRAEKEKINNSLILEAQRDALVSYILNLDQIKLKKIRNVEELCGYMLIDVPMGSCMPTTPIRQAMSTVQTFVTRCLLKLETKLRNGKEVGVAPGTIDEDQWLPKSLFRVWQVTMEFLVNPYPYLSYKYLKEKSSAAKTLEEDLLKNDITPRNVEESYRRYLHATLQTANLEIVSSFVDDIDTDNDNKTTLMHVIGKSRSAPHNYFYCIKNEQDRWTPWEKIDVAIKENDADGKGASGAHVMFTKFRDRYYLIMPEFVKRQKNELPTLTSGKSLTPNNLATENLSAFAAKPFWEIKIAVSEYYNKKWSPKQYLKTVLDEDDVFDTLYSEDVSKYIFTFEPGTDSSLLFHIRMKGSTIRTEFEFRGVNASVLVSKKSNLSVKADVSFQNFVFRELRFPVDNVVDQPLIFKEARKHKLINTPYPGSDLATAYVSPFFFHDQDRTYFATSQPITYDLQEAQVVDRPPLTRNPREYQVKLIAHPETFAFLPSLSLTASKMLIKRTGI